MARSVGTGAEGRRRVLTFGLGGVVAPAVGGVGYRVRLAWSAAGRDRARRADGACAVPGAPLSTRRLALPSPARATRKTGTGAWATRSPRRATDPATICPGGDAARLGGDHADALVGMSPARAGAEAGGRALAAMAMVTVDGGSRYWKPHPGDDPMAMVIDDHPAGPAARPRAAAGGSHDGRLDGRLRRHPIR